MRKIICDNVVCRAEFYFDEEKNTHAKLIRCPKCNNLQSVNVAIVAPPQPTRRAKISDDDWSHTPKPEIKPREVDDRIGCLWVKNSQMKAKIPLRKGINRIGRESEMTDEDVNIRILDDFMSRHHCDIEVRWTGEGRKYDYILSDKAYPRKKASSNGTHVNGSDRLKVRDEVLLKDGDIIEVGRSKLLLKLP